MEEKMVEQIDVREYSDYLQVIVEGEESLDFALKYMRRVGDDCKRKGFKKALIVADTKGRLSSSDMSSLGGRISQYVRGIKIALVNRQSEDYGRQLAEAISRASGSDAKSFNGPHQAESWLARG